MLLFKDYSANPYIQLFSRNSDRLPIMLTSDNSTQIKPGIPKLISGKNDWNKITDTMPNRTTNLPSEILQLIKEKHRNRRRWQETRVL